MSSYRTKSGMATRPFHPNSGDGLAYGECAINISSPEECRFVLNPTKVCEDDPVVLVAGADDNFAIGLTVTLSSALRHLNKSQHANIYVFDGGLTPHSREKLRRSLDAIRSDVPVMFIDLEGQGLSDYNHHGYSSASFLRLLIPHTLPEHFPRALYLDSDVLVMDDVAKLWQISGNGISFWAADDDNIAVSNYSPNLASFAARPNNITYFNSGVLLIDLLRWKESKISEKVFALLDKFDEQMLVPDQDALNAAAWSERGYLPPHWNFQVWGSRSASRLASDTDNPSIVHFLKHKPWMSTEVCAYQQEFDAALFASHWFSNWEFAFYRARLSVVRITAPFQKVIRRRLKRFIGCCLSGTLRSHLLPRCHGALRAGGGRRFEGRGRSRGRGSWRGGG